MLKEKDDIKFAYKKMQTLKFNFWIIFGSWLPFAFIAIFSNSLTLISQMIMGAAQSLSVFLSWQTTRISYRQQRNLPNAERWNAQFMNFVFLLSFLIVIIMAIDRLLLPRDIKEDLALFALIVNSFALIVNFIQWRKNLKLSKKCKSLVIESQLSLFFIKFFTVLTVEISLSLYFLLEGKGIHAYVDTLFSFALAILILFSTFQLFRKANGKD
jgi:divalent metal cation (Fe/Co/Zn/Cd) transporter